MTPEKKFRHYLFDFFMLFLAVFGGFVAENFREKQTEKQKENQYIRSLVQDCKYDTARFDKLINSLNKKIPYYDSVLTFLDNPGRFNNKLPFRFYIQTNLEHEYSPSEPTIQQLKHSGNLRLIENNDVLNAILIYDSHINGDFKDQTNYVVELNKHLVIIQEASFDFKNFNLFLNAIITNDSTTNETTYDQPLLSNTPASTKELANKFISAKASEVFYLGSINRVKKEAVNLIQLLQKEYQLK